MSRKERVKLSELEMKEGSGHPMQLLRTEVRERMADVLDEDEEPSIQPAPDFTGADFGVQVVPYARRKSLNPVQLAQELTEVSRTEKSRYIAETSSQGPYLNFSVNMINFGADMLNHIQKEGKDYGKEKASKHERVVFDMSSPNIAKRMSYGHLRSTVIGDSLARIYESEGYEVARDNHIGDWGTQFGKLIAAIDRWSSIEEIEQTEDRIGMLQDLYVKFHEESDRQKEAEGLDTSELEEEGRHWFKRLEEGDEEAKRIWKKTVDWSLEEFDEIYEALGVDFDFTLGESFYEDRLQDVIREVRETGVGKESEGALVVDMEDEDLRTVIVQKSDGASVYMTRDLACAIYREEELEADKNVYVVGADQKLYFRQLFEILGRMGHPIGENSEHVYFGMVSLKEGKMSTREGRVILLKDVIDEGLKRVKERLKESNPEAYSDPSRREEISKKVAIGALKWNDLAEDPRRNIIFDWDSALRLDGYSAPYVQYAAVRANRVIEKSRSSYSEIEEFKFDEEDDNQAEKDLIFKLSEFPDSVDLALEESDPSKIARYVYELAQQYNRFYSRHRILDADDEQLKQSRLALTASTRQVIENALDLLGIEVPSEM